MSFIKKNKAAIVFYLIITIGTLLICYNNEQYEKSISADIGFTDIQK